MSVDIDKKLGSTSIIQIFFFNVTDKFLTKTMFAFSSEEIMYMYTYVYVGICMCQMVHAFSVGGIPNRKQKVS